MINEICEIFKVHEYNEISTLNLSTFHLHFPIDDLIDHHVLSTLGNLQIANSLKNISFYRCFNLLGSRPFLFLLGALTGLSTPIP
jgi:hypothetical protein